MYHLFTCYLKLHVRLINQHYLVISIQNLSTCPFIDHFSNFPNHVSIICKLLKPAKFPLNEQGFPCCVSQAHNKFGGEVPKIPSRVNFPFNFNSPAINCPEFRVSSCSYAEDPQTSSPGEPPRQSPEKDPQDHDGSARQEPHRIPSALTALGRHDVLARKPLAMPRRPGCPKALAQEEALQNELTTSAASTAATTP